MSAERICLFFFNDTATTEIYTLSLHDALPIYLDAAEEPHPLVLQNRPQIVLQGLDLLVIRRHPVPHQAVRARQRSEEHTSELQSRQYLVCRLLLEKKTPDFIPVRDSMTAIAPM